MDTTKPKVPFPEHLRWLTENYFSNPDRRVELKKGDILLRECEENNRLYMVSKGSFKGYSKDQTGVECEAFLARKHTFIGVPSFFSGSFISLNTVQAMEESVVYFIGREQEFIPDGIHQSLPEQFVTVIISEMVHRQVRMQKMAIEREETMKMLAHHEKMATLGKISAGIAHELNNAIAVLKRNTEWLSHNLAEIIGRIHSSELKIYTLGLDKGRSVSSAEARKKAKVILNHHKISRDLAHKLAQIEIEDGGLDDLLKLPEETVHAQYFMWDCGVTLRDMLTAADHATHVVKTIKALGAPRSEKQYGVSINDTIEEALTLLSSGLRKVTVDLNLNVVPRITANKGEFVQIWMNLIQNACESMITANVEEPTVQVQSECSHDKIIVRIIDNGPGIPRDLMSKIFDPNVTTKSEGLSFGLGLGLTIVDRLVTGYHGNITVESNPGRTQFCIELPCGGNNV